MCRKFGCGVASEPVGVDPIGDGLTADSERLCEFLLRDMPFTHDVSEFVFHLVPLLCLLLVTFSQMTLALVGVIMLVLLAQKQLATEVQMTTKNPVDFIVGKAGNQQNVADAIKVSRQSVSYWKQRGEIPMDFVLSLAKAFKVPVTSLMNAQQKKVLTAFQNAQEVSHE
jgi:NADH:ubiquinone oxidoreductase subunit H